MLSERAKQFNHPQGRSYEEHLQRVQARRERLRRQLEERLPNEGAIDLEIGCGHGHWLTEYAAAHPERVCVGVDLIGDRLKRAHRKAERRSLENIHFVKSEATELLEELPQTLALRAVFMLFPDPWPKKRHWKNRLFNVPLLRVLAERCVDGGALYFRTDHGGYFNWACDIAEKHECWKVDKKSDWPFEWETVFQAKADSYQSLILLKEKSPGGGPHG